MTLRKWRRVAMALMMVALPLLTAGCTDNPREPGGGGGKASGTTERGGGVTSASPGGGNVRPGESSNEAVR
jgi:hypothetical protein